MPTKEQARAFVWGLLVASACWVALILVLEIQAVTNDNVHYPTEIYKK
jgi:hypothetical protein